MVMHTFVVLAYKESQYLEDCIKSVKNQKYNSNVIIATSTPNAYIETLAGKYNLEVVVRTSQKSGIGADFDFAYEVAKTELVTIAHQDDIYDKTYSYDIVEAYKKNKKAVIIFSNYNEIRNGEIVEKITNKTIKNILLTPIKLPIIKRFKFSKKLILAFGNSICCPAVTFCKNNITINEFFSAPFKSNVDWYAWELLSRETGGFVLVNKPLTLHRIHEEATTTEIINSNVRTNEDLEMFEKFWPKPIAKMINNYYKKSEDANAK